MAAPAMAADAPAQGRAPMTLGHLRITIRHFLGTGVQGVVVVGSTGRVAPRPRMPQVGQDRPAGRLGGYLPPETFTSDSLRAFASHLAAKPRHLVCPTATARDQPGSRGGSNEGCRRAPQGGCRHRPKTGSGFAAETRQRLSEAVWGAFADQGSVCANRRPDPHSTVGER